MGEDTAPPSAWEGKIEDIINQMMDASSEWEQKKFQAQLKDAQEGRANSMKIAQLQSETSRYGVDASREVALKQLKQRAFEFERTHALDIAKTATEYLSGPDLYFQGASFLEMTNRVGQGRNPQPYAYGSSPTPRTMADFNQLYTGGGQPERQPTPAPTGGAGVYGASGSPAPASSGSGGSAASAGGGGEAQAAQQAVQAIIKNVPPSEGPGLGDLQFKALEAARSLYEANLQPGVIPRMSKEHQAMLGSAGKRLGYHVPSWMQQQARNAPGQQSVRRA